MRAAVSAEVWMVGVDAAGAAAAARAAVAQRLAGSPHVLLETCHRVELYGTGEPCPAPGMGIRTGEAAARHLCRVAAGLESASPGEPEVLGQVRAALESARGRGPVAPEVARLFEVAIAAGRRVRARSAAPAPGLAEAAVDWLRAQVPLAGRPLLVAGRGVMGSALARAAAAAGAEVTFAGRRPRAGELTLAEAAGRAGEFAAIAIALSGPWPELVAPPPAPVADLSSPPALAAEVRAALGDRHLDIDDLFGVRPDAGRWARRAEEEVEAAVADFQAWLAGRASAPVIESLLDRLERRRRARVETLLRRAGGLEERHVELIDQLSRQLVSDVLHEPLTAIRRDRTGQGQAAARRLFNL